MCETIWQLRRVYPFFTSSHSLANTGNWIPVHFWLFRQGLFAVSSLGSMSLAIGDNNDICFLHVGHLGNMGVGCFCVFDKTDVEAIS
ncbi:hypothetical protein [Streptococcus penaeicida]|uniref:hypothetical protein n=1 Tax=Streptococcus penaeicida TaxID=1765960 RepID=UPI00101AE782|nr:hypothetical protein [Streptococcus penaeicida]